ncbi:MAG: glycosyltransferase N-terminal domain-containing protein [Paracoccaceae bacterium]
MARSLALSLYLATVVRGGAARKPGRFGPPLARATAFPNEHLGHYDMPRPTGPLVWFHAPGNDALRPLAELITLLADERPDFGFVITVTSAAQRMADRAGFPPRSAIVLTPDDSAQATRRFLAHWAPDIGVWIGFDQRPALLTGAAAQNVVLFALDGPRDMADAPGWRWLPGLNRDLQGLFARILVGDKASHARRLRLGAPADRLEEAGFLEEGAAPPPCDEDERSMLAAQMAARPVWLAAALDDAEVDSILAAHKAALRRAHRLLLIILPADPAQGDAIAAQAQAQGMITAQRALAQEPEREVHIYIADNPDEIGLWYRLAPISFLGQSLAGPGGGLSPYEAAALGSVVLHGPDVTRHQAAYARFSAAGAAILVRKTEDLIAALEMLQAPERVAQIAHAAWEVGSSNAAATDRITELILNALDTHEDG